MIKEKDWSKYEIEARYSLTAGLHQKKLQNIMEVALGYLKKNSFCEWINEGFLLKEGFLSFRDSLEFLHRPRNVDDISPPSKIKDFDSPSRGELESKKIKDSNFYSRKELGSVLEGELGEVTNSLLFRRLAYDELFAMQLSLQVLRQNNNIEDGKEIKNDSLLVNKLIEYLPFSLTKGQLSVIEEIQEDFAGSGKMIRLLQGDVGCGKTIVAMVSCLYIIESGYQAAFMAPTSVLAGQLHNFAQEFLQKLDIRIAFVTGSVKGKKRENILKKIKDGEIDLVIGTHALFYDGVEFCKLGLSVIDEQHRFGVEQRGRLTEKSKNPSEANVLLMSATPIPRTLSLTIYGDINISTITEKPAGRKEIITRIMEKKKIPDILEGFKRAIENDEKIYWVCPLVEESEILNFSAAIDRFEIFKEIFGVENIGLVHGKMKEKEKNQALDSFINGETKILVATTVIEVGVNAPDSTIMVIEHAEQFGLAGLHQLRGRVGRGNKQGKCILLYDQNNIKHNSLKRLKILRDSNDGFYIAEKDLQIRGSGDVLGTKQSGLPEFRIANLAEHFDLLQIASKDAKLLLNQDPELMSERGEASKVLLDIFDYNPHDTII